MMHSHAASRPLTILYVLAAFPVLSETFVSNDIRAMRRLGHRVVPLALTPHDGPFQPNDAPLRDETLHLGGIPTLRAFTAAAANPAGMAAAVSFANAQTGLPAKSLLRAACRVALAARQHGCTHIHAHFAHSATATAIAAAKIAGLSVSFIGHGYDIYGTPSDLALKLANADVAVATCEDMREDFLRLCPGAEVTVISCGIDPEQFTPVAGRSNGRLLAIGRLAPQKGYPVLFEALARIPADRRPALDIVGSGAQQAELEAMVARLELGDCVSFLGRRSSEWIADEGPRYQGFVAPYVFCEDGDRDTCPVSVKEAAAMGLPVVASYLMGMKQTVHRSSGRHVMPGDVDELAAAIEWLAGLHPHTRRELGSSGRTRMQAGYTIAHQAMKLTDAIAMAQLQRAVPCAA